MTAAVLSFSEARHRMQAQERMRRGDAYCLSCRDEQDEVVFLQVVKRWGGNGHEVHWCPECGWDDG
jgi:hypothetical protein